MLLIVQLHFHVLPETG